MEMTAETVTDYLLKINAKKSTCPDGFSPKIIKLSAPAIATPLANLFNHCIGISALPSEWKMSNVTPTYLSVPSPAISNLFEKVMFDKLQCIDFLCTNFLTFLNMSGFLKGR